MASVSLHHRIATIFRAVEQDAPGINVRSGRVLGDGVLTERANDEGFAFDTLDLHCEEQL